MKDPTRRTLDNLAELIGALQRRSSSGGDVENAFNLFVDVPELSAVQKSLEQMVENMDDEVAGLNKDRTDEPFFDDPGYATEEFSESPKGYDARHKWAERYDDLNGAPEGEFDR